MVDEHGWIRQQYLNFQDKLSTVVFHALEFYTDEMHFCEKSCHRTSNIMTWLAPVAGNTARAISEPHRNMKNADGRQPVSDYPRTSHPSPKTKAGVRFSPTTLRATTVLPIFPSVRFSVAFGNNGVIPRRHFQPYRHRAPSCHYHPHRYSDCVRRVFVISDFWLSGAYYQRQQLPAAFCLTVIFPEFVTQIFWWSRYLKMFDDFFLPLFRKIFSNWLVWLNARTICVCFMFNIKVTIILNCWLTSENSNVF